MTTYHLDANTEDESGRSDQTFDVLPKAQRGRPQIVSMQWGLGTLRVTPTGPGIGEREAFIIARNVHDAFDRYGLRMKNFVLDLRNVQTVSSLGLGVCVDLRHAARAKRAKSILYFGEDSPLRELFRMMRVDQLFRVVAKESALPRMTP
ncbi:MAG: anti-sigma factor antagonist [Phycisphaerales bacterium]|nr:MAG: anti-sigma factor antagonist [Phycisphaerales bacterium]